MGSLSNLNTSNKNNMVAALNEVQAKVPFAQLFAIQAANTVLITTSSTRQSFMVMSPWNGGYITGFVVRNNNTVLNRLSADVAPTVTLSDGVIKIKMDRSGWDNIFILSERSFTVATASE